MLVRMPKGDIKYVHFIINDPYGEITDIDFTEINFCVRRRPNDYSYCFQKTLGSGIKKLDLGDYMVKIEPADTNNMAYGNYIFDIQVKYKDLLKETFSGTFILKE